MTILRPVVLLGAARSGTKIMRDSLAVALDAPAVPYDVGYVWRYGNESAPDDCLPPDAVKARTRRLVHSFLGKYHDERGLVLEKTVGNTLRVPYVADVLPNAVFVHLIRDGSAVAESARREWQRPSDMAYLRDKLRHFPVRMLPTYGRKFVAAQTLGRLRHEQHVSTWGPRYRGIDEDLAAEGLLTVCARQWRECVAAARRDLPRVRQQVVDVRYEEFVARPRHTLARVVSELDLPTTNDRLDAAASKIDPRAANDTRHMLTAGEREILRRELGPTMEELGYAGL